MVRLGDGGPNAKPGTDGDANLPDNFYVVAGSRKIFTREIKEMFFSKGSRIRIKARSIPLQRAVKRSRRLRYLRQVSYLQAASSYIIQAEDKSFETSCISYDATYTEVTTGLNLANLLIPPSVAVSKVGYGRKITMTYTDAEAYHGTWTSPTALVQNGVLLMVEVHPWYLMIIVMQMESI